MGDIDSVSGVHIVQLEKRQLKIEKCKYFFWGGGGGGMKRICPCFTQSRTVVDEVHKSST